MTTKSFFFYGVYDGNDNDETWKVLHEHFEKLARENDERVKKVEITERRARPK